MNDLMLDFLFVTRPPVHSDGDMTQTTHCQWIRQDGIENVLLQLPGAKPSYDTYRSRLLRYGDNLQRWISEEPSQVRTRLTNDPIVPSGFAMNSWSKSFSCVWAHCGSEKYSIPLCSCSKQPWNHYEHVCYVSATAHHVRSHVIDRVQVVSGFEAAMDIYDAGMLLQFDVTHKVLRNDTALDVMCEMYNKCRNDVGRLRHETANALLGRVVVTKWVA